MKKLHLYLMAWMPILPYSYYKKEPSKIKIGLINIYEKYSKEKVPYKQKNWFTIIKEQDYHYSKT